MPRPCAVSGCENDEDNMICHRFPNDKVLALLWKHELNLKDFSVEMLQKNFSVCNAHFNQADYKHMHELKSTALPIREQRKEQKDNVMKTDLKNNGSSSDNSDSIEIVQPTKMNLALLKATLAALEDEEKHQKQREKPKNEFKKHNDMVDEDIFVLEAQESYYEHSKRNSESIDSPDFIILNAPNEKPHDDNQHAQTTNSAAESDVEILHADEYNSNPVINMSKSVMEITAAIALASLDTNYESAIVSKAMNSPTPTDDDLKLPSLEPLGDFPEFFTDQDALSNRTTTCSSANLFPPTNHFDELERQELLKIIHEQANKIEKLEAILHRYRTTHNTFLGHVDAIRLELENIDALEQKPHMPLNISLKK